MPAATCTGVCCSRGVVREVFAVSMWRRAAITAGWGTQSYQPLSPWFRPDRPDARRCASGRDRNRDRFAPAWLGVRDREMAWKLGFDAYRHARCPAAAYQNLQAGAIGLVCRQHFSGFPAALMAVREGLAVPS